MCFSCVFFFSFFPSFIFSFVSSYIIQDRVEWGGVLTLLWSSMWGGLGHYSAVSRPSTEVRQNRKVVSKCDGAEQKIRAVCLVGVGDGVGRTWQRSSSHRSSHSRSIRSRGVATVTAWAAAKNMTTSTSAKHAQRWRVIRGKLMATRVWSYLSRGAWNRKNQMNTSVAPCLPCVVC